MGAALAAAAPLPRHAEPQGHGGAALTKPVPCFTASAAGSVYGDGRVPATAPIARCNTPSIRPHPRPKPYLACRPGCAGEETAPIPRKLAPRSMRPVSARLTVSYTLS